MHRQIATTMRFCAFLFASALAACATSPFSNASISPDQLSIASDQGPSLPLPFRSVTLHTVAGTFTYRNVAIERTVRSGSEALALHIPNGEVFWRASSLNDIAVIDYSLHSHRLDFKTLPLHLHQSTSRSASYQHIACYPGECGGGGSGGACDPNEDQFDGCSTTQYYDPYNNAGCWEGQPCGFTDPNVGTGEGEVLFPDHSGCWLNFTSNPYWFDCWDNFITQYNWEPPKANLYVIGQHNNYGFGVTCRASGQQGWLSSHYDDTGLGFEIVGLYWFQNQQYTWTNPGTMNNLFFSRLPNPSSYPITLHTNWYSFSLSPWNFAYCNYTK